MTVGLFVHFAVNELIRELIADEPKLVPVKGQMNPGLNTSDRNVVIAGDTGLGVTPE